MGEILPRELEKSSSGRAIESGETSFADLLKNSFEQTNQLQEQGERAATDIATGQVKDLHQAAIALGKAESSMKLMLEIRNKAISAYKEILRTQM
ncbi:MAG: flagellar hook-basal body complex protein FliE [Campylobacterales bacterium]